MCRRISVLLVEGSSSRRNKPAASSFYAMQMRAALAHLPLNVDRPSAHNKRQRQLHAILVDTCKTALKSSYADSFQHWVRCVSQNSEAWRCGPFAALIAVRFWVRFFYRRTFAALFIRSLHALDGSFQIVQQCAQKTRCLASSDCAVVECQRQRNHTMRRNATHHGR